MADNELRISTEIAEAVNNALATMNPILLSYVDASGQPHLSFRGTTQVYSDDQLALWARDASGGLPSALPGNPKVALLYRNPETRAMYIFSGRGHVDNADAVRKQVFDSSPEREQQADPERKGVAIIVDLDMIEGRTAEGPFKLTR
jgi:hypothetical protein